MPLHWRKRLDPSSFRSTSTTLAWSMYVYVPPKCAYTSCHLFILGCVANVYNSLSEFLYLLVFLLVSFQFGNTCYCNSVLQALYFCRPFREKILAYRSQPRRKENLLTCLADLFHSIANQKRKVGVIPPKKFITRLRKENG